jgi:hypothetical protein
MSPRDPASTTDDEGEVRALFATAEKLSAEDRDAILAIAREPLVPWGRPPSPKPEAVAGTRPGAARPAKATDRRDDDNGGTK